MEMYDFMGKYMGDRFLGEHGDFLKSFICCLATSQS